MGFPLFHCFIVLWGCWEPALLKNLSGSTFLNPWRILKISIMLVEGKCRFGRTYTSTKVCVKCVTSLVTKVTSDDVIMMKSWWNTSRMLRMSKISDMCDLNRIHDRQQFYGLNTVNFKRIKCLKNLIY